MSFAQQRPVAPGLHRRDDAVVEQRVGALHDASTFSTLPVGRHADLGHHAVDRRRRGAAKAGTADRRRTASAAAPRLGGRNLADGAVPDAADRAADAAADLAADCAADRAADVAAILSRPCAALLALRLVVVGLRFFLRRLDDLGLLAAAGRCRRASAGRRAGLGLDRASWLARAPPPPGGGGGGGGGGAADMNVTLAAAAASAPRRARTNRRRRPRSARTCNGDRARVRSACASARAGGARVVRRGSLERHRLGLPRARDQRLLLPLVGAGRPRPATRRTRRTARTTSAATAGRCTSSRPA